MSLVLALSLFAVFIVILAHIVTRLRPMALGGALPLAFAAFISLESILLNGLGLFQGIDRASLLGVHLLLILAWLWWVLRADERRKVKKYLLRYMPFAKRMGPVLSLLLPLLTLIGLAAVLYAPNNYDSLTYHMARVAHWLQNGSVEYYPTIIERQNVMGPGAEYVILFFQALTSSDRLAPLVQLFAYVFLVFSFSYINRILRLPKAWSPAIIILAASTPIAVMEASNTKNDLVATLMAFAIIVAGMRLIAGDFRKMKLVDFGMLGVAVAAGYLVKPTSLLVAAPILAISFAVNSFGSILLKKNLKKAVQGACIVVLIIAGIAGPDIYRKHLSQISRHEVYPLFSEYTTDRLWNPVRVLAHNTPFPEATGKILRSIGYKGDIITKDVFNLHEDMIGNPWQVSAFVMLTVVTVLAGFWSFVRASLWPTFLLSLAPVAAWGAFGLMVKDQGWITRLEMPLFFILPFSFVFLGRLASKNRWLKRSVGACIIVVALISLSYGVLVACKVPARPVLPANFWGEEPGRIQTYYNNAPSLLTGHNYFLKQAAERRCSRIGLVMGPDSAEYPLTWRAMTAGLETRHLRQAVHGGQGISYETVVANATWPCMIFADDGVVEHVPNRGEQWLSAGDYHTFYRNYAWDFDRSTQTLLHLGVDSMEKLTPQQDLRIESSSEAILLMAEGTDPQLILPDIERGDISRAVMKVVVASPEETEMQLYYQTATKAFYSERESMKRTLAQGDNTVFFPLDLDKIVGPLRLDIAMKSGKYELSTLEIRALP